MSGPVKPRANALARERSNWLTQMLAQNDATRAAANTGRMQGQPVYYDHRNDTLRATPPRIRTLFGSFGSQPLVQEPRTPIGKAARFAGRMLGLDDPLSMIEGPARAMGVVGKVGKAADFVHDAERTLYHGSTAKLQGPLRVGPTGDAIYLTANPRIASDVYAGGLAAPNMAAIRPALAKLSDSEVSALVDNLRRERKNFPYFDDDVPLRDQLADYAEYSWDEFEGPDQVADALGSKLRVPGRGPIEGGHVSPVTADLKNPKIVDASKESFDPEWQGKLIEDAKAAGHDGVIFRNYEDGGYGFSGQFRSAGRHDVYAVFDPAVIRQKFAKPSPSAVHAEKMKAVNQFLKEERTPFALNLDPPPSRNAPLKRYITEREGFGPRVDVVGEELLPPDHITLEQARAAGVLGPEPLPPFPPEYRFTRQGPRVVIKDAPKKARRTKP